MTTIYLTNTLTRKKEEFVPFNPKKVGMYVCGPTVYDRPHLGNARSAVIYDILFRLLKEVFTEVVYTRNITDVDDKIIAACKASGETSLSLTTRIAKLYHEDMLALGCLAPTFEPKATDNINNMIVMIESLIRNRHAYEAEKHVLFDTSSFSSYGCLSGRSREEMIAGARVEVAPFKKDPADFVLWKPVPKDEFEFGFDSPWGRGRPGWHIECSAMSKEILGEKFDIHGGGADLMFPHHENELAQSYCVNGEGKFAKYWVHNGFLTVEGEKMSKSLGNFLTVNDVLSKGVEGMAIRCFYLATHYRKPLDYSSKAIDDAKHALEKFKAAALKAVEEVKAPTEIISALADDINTPLALAKLHELSTLAQKGDIFAAAKVKAGCDLLGLNLSINSRVVPTEIYELADLRMKAKSQMNWAEADRLREEITAKGFKVKDTKTGYEIS